MATLKGMSEEARGQDFPIENDELSIGRAQENVVAIDNASVSGRHCSIKRDGRKFSIRDLGSTNGTRVNSREIQESFLKPKDIIQVGSIEFIFDADEMEVEFDDSDSLSETRVEEEKGVAGTPDSFASISPFGSRNKESKGLWFTVITIIGILALALVAFFFFRLVTTT